MAYKRKRLCEEDNQQAIEKEEQMKNTAPSLDEHILFDIFTRIPADILHNNFKYQCRQWQHLITDEYFIKSNSSRSKPGIIFIERVIRNSHYRYLLKSMELNMKGSEVIRVRELHDFKTEISIISSCYDLILLMENKSRLYHVMNLITKKCITFPLLEKFCWCQLVFIGEYKLVEMYHSKNYIPFLSIRTLDTCAKAKHVEVPEACRKSGYRRYYQILINGVLYWDEGKYIISFDLYNETFLAFQMPNGISYHYVELVNISGSLSLIEYIISGGSSDAFNIWSTRNTIGGMWEKVISVRRLGFMRIGEENYWPTMFVAALDHGKLLLFRGSHNKLGAYDVTTKRWSLVDDRKCPVNNKSVYYCHRAHVIGLHYLDYLPSLVWKSMDDM